MPTSKKTHSQLRSKYEPVPLGQLSELQIVNILQVCAWIVLLVLSVCDVT
jgi:hypothetical protein